MATTNGNWYENEAYELGDALLTTTLRSSGWCLHEWLLTEWGTPIGEMWDLETLSKVCEKENRWSFFLTSAPLHVKGGVGTFEQCASHNF